MLFMGYVVIVVLLWTFFFLPGFLFTALGKLGCLRDKSSFPMEDDMLVYTM